MKYVLTAYVTDASLSMLTQEDVGKLTHMNIAFGKVANDTITTKHLKNLKRLSSIREYNPELKILLSVGGWGAGGFSEAAATKEGRTRFARSAVSVLEEWEFDGIDLDWEYPCYSQADIVSSPRDKYTFTELVLQTREEIDKHSKKDGKAYLLTIATGADQYYIDGTEMDKVEQCLDLIQLMTYDMRGGFQTLTGHHTNLFTPTGDLFRISVDASVNLFQKAGVPPEKIVIGAAFYSRMWKNTPNKNNGLHQMTDSFGGYGPSYSDLAANYINRNGYTRFWDDEAKAPYLFDGSNFISYDDEQSLRAKCRYLKENNLAGIMFWEYRHDKTHTLLHTMYEALR